MLDVTGLLSPLQVILLGIEVDVLLVYLLIVLILLALTIEGSDDRGIQSIDDLQIKE
jgi:hypothetical protein